MEEGDVPFRILPALSERSGFFWTSGRDGVLRFLRCNDCGAWLHPPGPICPFDHSKNLAPAPVSGRARVHTFSINHQPWMPGPELPYTVAIVEIEEDPRVRLTTNIVGCRPEDVRIGMAVRVVFEHHEADGEEVWLPLFEPDPEREEAAGAEGAGEGGR